MADEKEMQPLEEEQKADADMSEGEVKEDAAEEARTQSVQTESAIAEDVMTEDAQTGEEAETPQDPQEAAEDEDSEDSDAGDADAQNTDGKKGSGKKKKKFLKDKRDQKIEELNDRLLRNMAEFENFRNRSEKEKSAMFEIGAKSVVEKILPVVDNFERGLSAVSEDEKENAFVKGMEAVYKQFTATLGEIGVTPIEAVGKEFDPNLHNAVMHAEDDSMEANMVSEELQKGYMYKDSVVRHSMVKVVN